MADDLITIRNKRTGEVRQVPRSQYVTPSDNKGISGVANDVISSLQTAPEAASNMLWSIPGGAANVGRYITNKSPVETLANLGAGGTESLAGLVSSPQVLARYLADKFPAFRKFAERGTMPGSKGISDPTIYESLMNLEQQHGLAPQSEEEASVRNLGGLLFGGKGLTKLSSPAQRLMALSATEAGQGGDPVHAALLGAIGEIAAKGLGRKPKQSDMATTTSTPNMNLGNVQPSASFSTGMQPQGLNVTLGGLQYIPEIMKATGKAIKATPEVLGRTAASMLENAADYGSKIPMGTEILQPTAGAIAAKLKHLSTNPEKLAKQNLFGDIELEDLPTMRENAEAANRLNLTYTTPSELLQSPFESVKQGTIGRTTPGMKELYKRGQEREASEEKAINKLFDLIHTEELNPEKQRLYKQAMEATLPEEFIQTQAQRPVIQKAIKAVKNNTAYKQMLQEEYGVNFDKVPANSFMFWDMVKRVLYDMEKKSSKKGGSTESSVYGNTRKSMVDQMDAIAPEYADARRIAERGFTREELKNIFDKKAKNFNNFNNYIGSTENYENLLRKLSDLPQATQQLMDIKRFAGNMVPNSPTIRAAAALKRTGMSDARNKLDAIKRQLDEKYGAEHDVAAVKLMTDKNLMAKLEEYLKEKGKL